MVGFLLIRGVAGADEDGVLPREWGGQGNLKRALEAGPISRPSRPGEAWTNLGWEVVGEAARFA